MNRTLTAVALIISLALPVTAATTYGPTRDQETLWSIASRLKPKDDISVQQVALALYRKNPQAFESANINALKHNVFLQMPTLAEMQATSYVQAVRTTKWHNHAWQQVDNPNLPPSAVDRTTLSKVTKAKQTGGVHTRTIVKVIEKPVVVAGNSSLRKQQETEIKRLKQQVSALNKELAAAKNQTRSLRQQLATAKMPAPSSTIPTTTNTPTPVANQQPTQQEIEIARQVQKLTAQVADLESVLEEKNNHINNLQATLKNASETIKRQHTENQLLVNQLNTKAAGTGQNPAPNATATPQTSNGPELKLAEVPVPSTGNESSVVPNTAANTATSPAPNSVVAPSTANAVTETVKAENNQPSSTTKIAGASGEVPNTASTQGPSANAATTTAPIAKANESVPSEQLAAGVQANNAQLNNVVATPNAAGAQPTQGVWAEETPTNRSNATMQPTNDVRAVPQPLIQPTNESKPAGSNSVASDLNLAANTPAAPAKPLFGANGLIPPPSKISYVIGLGALGLIGFLWWRSRLDKKLKGDEFPTPEQERRRKTIRQDPVIPFEAKSRDSVKSE